MSILVKAWTLLEVPQAAICCLLDCLCSGGCYWSSRTFTCCLWVFFCKPPAPGKNINLKDFEDKFSYDGEFEAPALEHKVPIEKQKVVIDAWKQLF